MLLALLALALPALAPAVGPDRGDDPDPIAVILGDVTVHRGETVEGVFIVSGDARIDGRVEDDVIVLDGDVVVGGHIEGDLFTAGGRARLLAGAEVDGDVRYGDERPIISTDARVRGDLEKESWPDLGGLTAFFGAFLFWLAITVTTLVLGALLLLIAPRAADALHARSRERVGPVIAIGIAILIVLPVTGVLAAITVLGLPLAVLVFLALLPLGAVAYVTSAYALGRAILKPPRERLLSFLVGLAILRAGALVPILGLLVGLAAVIFGLGLIGAAIGAARAREEDEAQPSPAPPLPPPPPRSPGS